MNLKDIINQFFIDPKIKEEQVFGNGHINSTYKLSIENDDCEYILQKINKQVFKNPQNIIQNHLKFQKLIKTAMNDLEIPHLIPTLDHQYLYMDKDHNAWRMINFIKESETVEVFSNDWQAFEAGKGFGWFAQKCSVLNPSEFYEAIPNFHRLSFRINQFKDAIKDDCANRLEGARYLVNSYKEKEKKLQEIEDLIESGKIPVRLVHNDTKINNLLFRNEKAVAVIDLDTVGPGTIFYDYGDALRTIANTAAEDEKDLSMVHFNLNAFDLFSKAYLNQTKSILTEYEKKYLFLAPQLMTFIIGIRFLTDYLNGDKYYKVKFPEHNLIRSLVQNKLISEMENHSEKMKQIIINHLY